MQQYSLFIPSNFHDYELLDVGDRQRLERFGNNIVCRSESTALWPAQRPDMQKSAMCSIQVDTAGRYQWHQTARFVDPWHISYLIDKKKLTFLLRFSGSKNIGLFPEQASNWEWLAKKIRDLPQQPQVLNLFAYTGAASLVAAACGARVTHVDASKAAVSWARSNADLSGLQAAPIRWIVDDCATFIRREIARKKTYDIIIMDPPAFGRDPRGRPFSFKEQARGLLIELYHLLDKKHGILLCNGYAMGHSPLILEQLAKTAFRDMMFSSGELAVQEIGREFVLPCSVVTRGCMML